LVEFLCITGTEALGKEAG